MTFIQSTVLILCLGASFSAALADERRGKQEAKDAIPCQVIQDACQSGGYRIGEHKKGNGLWVDCFDPALKGQIVARLSVPKNVVSACAVNKTSACQTVRDACESAGFVLGQKRSKNGLWSDCFEPLVRGEIPVRSPRVPSAVLAQCRADRELITQTPVFTPAAGRYVSTQTVSIQSTVGARIYYTVDGTTPSTKSEKYSAPIIVAADKTIKAYAVKAKVSSPAAAAAYVIGRAPVVLPISRQSYSSPDVSITPDAGCEIVTQAGTSTDGVDDYTETLYPSCRQADRPTFAAADAGTSDCSLAALQVGTVYLDATPEFYEETQIKSCVKHVPSFTGPADCKAADGQITYDLAMSEVFSTVVSICSQDSTTLTFSPITPPANGTFVSMSCAAPGACVYTFNVKSYAGIFSCEPYPVSISTRADGTPISSPIQPTAVPACQESSNSYADNGSIAPIITKECSLSMNIGADHNLECVSQAVVPTHIFREKSYTAPDDCTETTAGVERNLQGAVIAIAVVVQDFREKSCQEKTPSYVIQSDETYKIDNGFVAKACSLAINLGETHDQECVVQDPKTSYEKVVSSFVPETNCAETEPLNVVVDLEGAMTPVPTLECTPVVTVTAVTSTKADGSYKAGEVIEITVTFSESVTVSGTPTLTLETSTTDAVVIYTSGSPGTVLTFNYTVAAGENSGDLDYASTMALALNSGTIQDATLNDADLTLAAPGTTGSIAYGKVLVVDTTPPTLAFSSISVANPGVTRTPTILGTGSEVSTVTLYLDSACSGLVASAPTENWAFASPGIVLSEPVGFNSSNTVIYGRAVDVAGNVSACTSLVSYTHSQLKLGIPVASHAAGLYNAAITPTFTQDSRSLGVAVSTTVAAPDCASPYTPSPIVADTTFKVVSCPTSDAYDASDILTVAYTFNIITPLGVVAHPNVDGYPTILWDTSSAFDLQKEAEINIFEPYNWIDHFSWHYRPSSPSPLAAGRVVTKKPLDYSWFGSAAQEYSADVFAMSISSVFCPGGYCADTTPAHSVKLGSYKKELPASFASSDIAGWAGIMTEVDRVSRDCEADPCVYFSDNGMEIKQIHLNSRTSKIIAHSWYGEPILALVFEPTTKRLIIGGDFPRFWNMRNGGYWDDQLNPIQASGLVAMNVETKAVVTIPLTVGEGVLSEVSDPYVAVRGLAVSGSGVIYAGVDLAGETADRVIRADISDPTSPALTLVRGGLHLGFNSLSFNDVTKVLQISGYTNFSSTVGATAYCRVQTDVSGYPAACIHGGFGQVLSKGGKDYVSGYSIVIDNILPYGGIFEMSTSQANSVHVDQYISYGGVFVDRFVKTDSGDIYASFNGNPTINGQSYPGRMVRLTPAGANAAPGAAYTVLSDLDGGFGASHIYGYYNSGTVSGMMAFTPTNSGPAKIFMAGWFSRVGRDTVAHDFAVYDEASGWDALRTAQKELVGTVRAQVVDTSSSGCTPLLPCIYVAGDITQAPSSSSVGNIPVHGVAMFKAGVWTDLNPSAGLPAGLHVTSLAIDRRVPAEPKLIVGGNTMTDTETSHAVFSRPLTAATFTHLLTGQGELRGLAVMGQNLVVAGDFGLKIKSLEGSEVSSSQETLSLTVDDGVSPPKLYVGLSGGVIKLATVTDSAITFTDAFGTGTSPLTGDVRALAVDVSKGIVMASIRDITGINPCVCLVAGSEASNRLMEYKAGVWGSPRLMAGLATGIPVKDAPFSFIDGVPGTRNFGWPTWFDWRTTTMDPLLTSKIFDFEVRMVQPPNGDWSNGPLGGIFDFDMDKVWPAQINALTISRDQSSGCSEDFPCVYIGGRFHYVHGKMRPNFMKYMPLFKEVL